MFADIQTVKDLKNLVSGLIGEVSDHMPQSSAADNTTPPAVTNTKIPVLEEAAPVDDSVSSSWGANTPFSSGISSPSKEHSRAASPASAGTTVPSEQKEVKPKPAIIHTRPALSLLLQDRPQAGKKTFFLFSDAAGSASSYSNLPKVNPDLTIVGLNCPYARFPEEMKCTLGELIEGYNTDLRRR